MYRELVISIIIIGLIFSLEYITQKSTSKYLEETISDIKEIKEELNTEGKDEIILKEKVREKYKKWNEYYKILAFYIEHNELEKIQANYVSGKGCIEVKEYETANVEFDETIFLLEHLKEKYLLKLKNIF